MLVAGPGANSNGAGGHATNRLPTTTDRAVGQRIRALRRAAGMTLSDLGEAVGVSGVQFQRYETGASRVAASRLLAICDALDVPVLAKSVGSGIAASTAARLLDAGVIAIDVAGAGGTSWALVEGRRADDPVRERIAAAFGDWLYFARGPYSAKAIEIRTAVPGFPPHPGWHSPWV